MLKKTKKLIIILTALMMLTMGIPVMAAVAIPHVGAERYFESKLPLDYVNVYFQTRTKQSNYALGYVRLTSKSDRCSGINAWFCDANLNRCSSITRCDALNTEFVVYYNSNYALGSSVRLGIEDLNNDFFKHTVVGYVNYN